MATRTALTGAATLWLAAAAAGCGGGGGAPGGGASGAADTGASPMDGGPAGGRGRNAAPQPAPDSLVRVDEFLAYDPADSLVDLKLWAGHRGTNSAWNFNGYFNGNATVLVPAGWRVAATFQNLDANLAHSAGVVEAEGPVPASGDLAKVAFPGAATGTFTAGFSSRDRPQTLRFTAAREGRFRIYCGVPGHGPGGMWIWLEVSSAAAVPELRTG